MPSRPPRPTWHAQRQQTAQPNARTATVARLIDRAVAETGQAPTDQALADLLASSVARIRHHRQLIGR